MTHHAALDLARLVVARSWSVPCLVVLAAPAAEAQFGGFTWVYAGSPLGSGTASASGLHVVGPDAGPWGFCQQSSTSQFETIMPASGTISVDVDFVNLDTWVSMGHAKSDSPALLLDGVLMQPPAYGCCPDGWPTGAYHLDADVVVGQVLGLGVWSSDCAEGPGVADYTQLVFVPVEQTPYAAAIDVRKRFEVSALPGTELGTDCAGLADVDGDGCGDVVVLAPGSGTAAISVLSGKTAATLLVVEGDFADATVVASAGLFDEDGVPDFVVGMPLADAGSKVDAGRCEVRSGADGSLLFTLDGVAHAQLGIGVAGAGDLDADGHDDILVGELPTLTKKAKVRVLGGPDGHLIATFEPTSNSATFGQHIAGGGDADADGVPDVIVGEPKLLETSTGLVHLYSGATQDEWLTLQGTGSFGEAVDWAGDVDGDGHADVLAAAPGADGAGPELGAVTIVSGATGVTLLSVSGDAGQTQLGYSVSGGSDLTGDGHLDFVAGASPSVTRIHDAVFGELEQLLAVPADSSSVVADVNGDGRDDLATSSATGGASGGQVIVFHNLHRGPPPTIIVSGAPVPGNGLTVAIGQLLPSVPLLLVVGTSELSVPFKGGVLVPQPELLVSLVASATGEVDLQATWPVGLPIWTSLWLQAWAPDADAQLGWIATDAVGLTQIVP